MTRRVVHITTVHQLRDPRIFYKQVPALVEAGYDVHLIAKADEPPTLPNDAPEGALSLSEGAEARPPLRAEPESDHLARSDKGGSQPARAESEASRSTHSGSEVDAETGVTIHALTPVGQGRRASRFALNSAAYRKALALNADVYHIHDPELLPILRRLKDQTGAKVIYDIHEDYVTRGIVSGRAIRLLERWAFGWLDHVVLADDAYVPIVEGRRVAFTAIYNYPLARRTGVNQEAKTLPTSAEEGFRLIYTGVQSISRGLLEQIGLAQRIVEDKLPWTIDLVGVCYIEKDRREAEQLLSELDVGESLNLVGWKHFVDTNAMVPYLSKANVGLIFLRPHKNYVNVLPTKLFEYLQSGLPILCSDFPRMRAFVEEHDCGAVVDPTDTEAVQEILGRWASDAERYSELSRNALAASSSFRWSAMAGKLVALYAELLRR